MGLNSSLRMVSNMKTLIIVMMLVNAAYANHDQVYYDTLMIQGVQSYDGIDLSVRNCIETEMAFDNGSEPSDLELSCLGVTTPIIACADYAQKEAELNGYYELDWYEATSFCDGTGA